MNEYTMSKWTGFTWLGLSAYLIYAASVQQDFVAIVIVCFATGCLFLAGLLTLATGR